MDRALYHTFCISGAAGTLKNAISGITEDLLLHPGAQHTRQRCLYIISYTSL